MVEVKVLGGLRITVCRSGDDYEIVYVVGRYVRHPKHAAWLYKRIDADNRSWNTVWRALDEAEGLLPL